MRDKLVILTIIFTLLSSTSFSVANPGGNGDSNRDFTCGGSCHGDPSLSQESDGTLSLEVQNNVYAGNAVAVHITASNMSLSSNRIVGIFLLGSLNGNLDQPSDYGWQIIQDPNGGTNNYVESTVSSSNSITLTWILFAPEDGGKYNLFAQINHGRSQESNDIAYTGVSDPLLIDVQTPPANLPGFSEFWIAPEYRPPGDSTNVIIMTKNSNSIQVKWKLEGEWAEHNANVTLIEKDTWSVDLPPTLGSTIIQYTVTTSNGNFSIKQPLLTIGTSTIGFEGTLMGARLQSLALASIIIGFISTLQVVISKSNNLTNQNPSESSEISNDKKRYTKHSDHPGWLWDNIENKWIEDQNNSIPGDDV
ncbi:MAG: hypothetical protein CND89_01760 [Marine Group II euryarchaeote MED-G38]|uniref:Uncharacterized protein n=1 Tax=uncultured Poseidoniia archaeon TaxID=1697135 RepID=A0A1B1TC47_9ARCH|nr:hypothetical protein [uncultured Candidatus Thalassoarchaea sp.]MAV60278.1 hypothetical protein [Euryarchaeota archaeon]OUV25814.1 MAG: hypothetical protein CBC57_04185 [Euryarchaeota archaeon TMED97]PDH23518.1 MAG: hypothetical protein CND89_01760 [Marine Group II euryarchaeote MED-G38]|tara:strand:- start:3112 stop:4200 length:1089 start_codon:yes stop_codon:yes gene_type:complete